MITLGILFLIIGISAFTWIFRMFFDDSKTEIQYQQPIGYQYPPMRYQYPPMSYSYR